MLRLDENQQVLIETYDLITAAADQNRPIEPAAEWLLDNFYLVEEQILAIRRLLPPAYSRELPRLASGPAAGFPRAYGIAVELIAHVDGRVDAASLNGFIASYQSVRPLKLGELWALPLMLRLALIENLRRVAVRIASARRDRDQAGDWAEHMVTVVEQKPTDLILVLADLARARGSGQATKRRGPRATFWESSPECSKTDGLIQRRTGNYWNLPWAWYCRNNPLECRWSEERERLGMTIVSNKSWATPPPTHLSDGSSRRREHGHLPRTKAEARLAISTERCFAGNVMVTSA